MRLFEIMENKEMKIYCDLDGVLANFKDAFEKLTGKPATEKITGDDWAEIHKVGNFYYTLDLLADAMVLWYAIKSLNPTILTGKPKPSGVPEAEKDKKDWCHEKLGPDVEVIVCFAWEKRKYASPNAVLIDDTKKNIDEWIAAGGIGIFHENAEKTIQELKTLGIL